MDAQITYRESSVRSNMQPVALASSQARRIADGLRLAALQEAITLMSSEQPHADMTEYFVALLTARADGLQRAVADDLAGVALALGRHDEATHFKDDIAECVYTSVLDGNACDACAAADGTVAAFGSPEYELLRPPYAACEGMNRCRCQFVFTLRTEVGNQPSGNALGPANNHLGRDRHKSVGMR